MTPHRVILLVSATLLFSCSLNRTLEEEKVQTPQDQTPMVFGSSSAATPAGVTKAAVLESHFKVGVWKGYGTDARQTVMDGYMVEYDNSGEAPRWDYTGVEGQIQRYWDLGAFPYEFRAAAPYLEGASLRPDGITLDLTDTPFRAQSLVDDEYNYGEEADVQPCLVAHVRRQKNDVNYEDWDAIKDMEINDAAKGNPGREVHIPFHHLNAKVGFRIFVDDPLPTDPPYAITIRSLIIKVVKEAGFITASNTYTATTDQGLGSGEFSDNTTAEEFILLQHGNYQGVDIREYLDITHTYDLTPSFLQQIPQDGFKIQVQLTLDTNGVEDEEEEFVWSRWLSLDRNNTDGDTFGWEPDHSYIYYLHIPNLYSHEIELLSCEVLPWDLVQTTEIPVEL